VPTSSDLPLVLNLYRRGLLEEEAM
jgi:hypothetical protein